MPPWPGLPVGKASEGHYLFVNKNLIELLACLALAATPNGLWLGLDALLFGRRRRTEDAPAPEPSAPSPTSAPVPIVTVATTADPSRFAAKGTVPKKSKR